MGVGKNGNLNPPRSKEEATKRGKAGGIKSGQTRRRKRTMQQATKLLLDMPVTFENVKQQMKNLGIENDDLTNQMAIIVSMYKEAMSGNVRAAEFLRQTAGTGSAGEERNRRLQMDEERLEMEKDRHRKQMAQLGQSGDGLPTIINVRPQKTD